MSARIWCVVWCALLGLISCDDGAAGDQDPGPQDSGQVMDAGAITDAGRDADPSADASGLHDAALDSDAWVEPRSSAQFLEYARPHLIPGRFPASPCEALTEHHTCATTAGCGWMRTIKDNGLCRADPVSRCLSDGECTCQAHDFHGDPDREADLELFLPLSVVARNLAPRTSSSGGGADRYTVEMALEPIENESLSHFTSRTDFSVRRLEVLAADRTGLTEAGGLTLVLKFMPVWDRQPAAMSGLLFEAPGVRVRLDQDQLTLERPGAAPIPLSGEHPTTGGAKDYQCNQLALTVPASGDARIWLGAESTRIPGLSMAEVRAALDADEANAPVLSLGAINARIWDVRLYAGADALPFAEIAEIGKRCGGAGAYPIPEGYPESNTRYAYGMGGTKVVPHHEEGHFSSGVYVTLRIPEGEVFPPVDEAYRDHLMRMVGFWDRWFEQMYFEMDFIPYVDTRALPPEGSVNTYRFYPDPLCAVAGCGERINSANPCRYITDLFQAINWLPEDWPDEPTSADHRRIAERGGYGRWQTHDPDLYQRWTRPVHELGHSTHFPHMRTYDKVHHYVRGIAGEAFAEVMVQYVLTGVAPWMIQGLTYYPSIPLAFEGRWDHNLERHVFKSSQPYQARNIDDQGLGARFYGMGIWWTFVSHFAGKPYLVGRISADTDLTPGTTLQKTRFYLAQEGLDLGDLYANFVAHTATWDWPRIGHFLNTVEQNPFQGIEGWCTQNSGPDCTIDGLKTHMEVSPETGTGGAWVDGPADRQPGGFASNTIRIASAPAGALYAISLDFETPERLYPDRPYTIGLRSACRDDPRFFSSRIVVVDAGSEGQPDRARRPQYYKIPGRHVEEVIIQVPEGGEANVYVLPIPTPPFELEDVPGYVESFSLTWPYRVRITRLDARPEGAVVAEPTVLEGDETLSLDPQEGHGFTYDCFDERPPLLPGQ